MHDLLHISMEPWEPVWRRNQNIAAGFAKRFPDRKVLYVAPASDLSHAVRTERLKSAAVKASIAALTCGRAAVVYFA